MITGGFHSPRISYGNKIPWWPESHICIKMYINIKNGKYMYIKFKL